MPVIELPANGWKPRVYQEALWDYMRQGGQRGVAVWHRRAGKDELCLHFTACMAHKRVGAYWHMLPEASQARKAIWNMVNPHTGKRRIDEAFPIELRKRTDNHEMFIEFKNGSTWQVCGSDNYNSLVGSSVAGLIMSEYAIADPAAWAYFSPILLESKGWALFISTPRGKNHLYRLHKMAEKNERWFTQLLSVADTKIFTEEELQDELEMKIATHGEAYGRAMYEQEWNVSFDAAIPGAIWADCVERAEKEGRILDFEIDPKKLVYTAYDLGRTDDTAIWFYQFNNGKIDIFDYFASPGMDISNEEEPDKGLVQLLLKKARQYGIKYDKQWLPHDARPRTQAAGGKSILQQFMDAAKKYPELGSFPIVKRLDKQEGIIAARATFPHVRFHKTRCENGIESLRHYHREWDDEKKIFSDNAVHDWASHASDSFRYLSLSWKIPRPGQGPEVPTSEKLMAGNVVGLNFGQIKKQHFSRMASMRDE